METGFIRDACPDSAVDYIAHRAKDREVPVPPKTNFFNHVHVTS